MVNRGRAPVPVAGGFDPGKAGVHRAIFFDAVGTILHPDPSAVEVYHQVGQQFGSRLGRGEVAQRFRLAWKEQEQADRLQSWRTNEAREEQRWRFLVSSSLPDVTDPEACFQHLYDYFSRPDAWRIDVDLVPFLTRLQEEGYQLGLASNFDGRLRTLLTHFPQLNPLRHRVISSEIGWRKPSPEFFRHLTLLVDLPPDRIIVIGDDPMTDYEGAQQAGMQPILYQPRNQETAWQIRSWTELPSLLAALNPV